MTSKIQVEDVKEQTTENNETSTDSQINELKQRDNIGQTTFCSRSIKYRTSSNEG